MRFALLRKLAPLVVVVAGSVAYHNSLEGPFIFDDRGSILENEQMRSLWPVWRACSAPPGTGASGRPLVAFSLAINYALGGLQVRGYHIFNIAVHLLTGLALFGLVRRTLGLSMIAERIRSASLELGLCVAAVWVVHPLTTDALNHVIYRNEVLASLFFLLTVYCLVRGSQAGKSGEWYAAAVAACGLGMTCKEMMAGAPIVALLYDRAFLAGSFRGALRSRGRLYAGLAGTWLILGACILMGDRGGSTGMGVSVRFDGQYVGPFTYLMTQFTVIPYYLRLGFWPRPLVLDLGDWPLAGTLGEVGPAAGVTALLVVGTIVLWRRRPVVGVVCVAFWLILAPSSSLFPLAGEIAAEHRMYLPLALLITLAVLAMYTGFVRVVVQSRNQATVATIIVCTFLVIAGTLGTVRRNLDYGSEVSIWQDTVAKRPGNARAHLSLGSALMRAGEVGRAVGEFRQTIAMVPTSVGGHRNLADALGKQRRFGEAEQHLRRAVSLEPEDAEMWMMLGDAVAFQDRLGEAVGSYEHALRIDPERLDARIHLGNVLLVLGRFEDAARILEEALEHSPQSTEAREMLAQCRAKTQTSSAGD